jgi:hypothetical protein
MKKLIVMAAAAGALAVGGAASAQDLGSVVGSLFGFGAPQQTYRGDIPAVVAGTVPYGSTVTTDQYGRQVYVDQYGRQVLVQPQSTTTIVGYDQWGRPIYGNTTTYGSYGTYGNYAYANPNDRDRDGVVNWNDRWPDDPRYR